MKRSMSLRRATRGFTLLELVFAVAIIATALIGLQAAMGGAIIAAGDSVYQRGARELAVAKMEEALAGIEDGIEVPEPYTATSPDYSELQIGMPDDMSQTVRIVTITVTFPSDTEAGSGSIQLISIVPPEGDGQPAEPQ